MKKCKKLLSALLAVVLLLGTVPAFAADPDGGLNGSSGKWSEFDRSVYDTVADDTYVDVLHPMKDGTYDWPSGGTVVLLLSGSNYSLDRHCRGLKIPAGLVLDIYKYYKYGDTYTLLGHFDTTDGKPYTIGSGSGTSAASSSSNPGYTGTPDADGWVPRYEGENKWGRVRKTFTPGTPSASYKNSYTDVSPDAWYYDAVMTLTDNDILMGYGNGKFGPNDSLTRSQLALIKGRLHGTTDISYDAVNINDYKPYRDNAVATRAFAAIRIAGALPEFNKRTLTSYEQSVIQNASGLSSNDKYKTMMYESVYDVWRATLSKNIEYRSSIDQFPDAADIHRWIEENADFMGNALILAGYNHEELVQLCEMYFLRAYNLGMFGGVDDKGTFAPYAPITRGQLCQVLYNVGLTTSGCIDYNK